LGAFPKKGVTPPESVEILGGNRLKRKTPWPPSEKPVPEPGNPRKPSLKPTGKHPPFKEKGSQKPF